MKAVLLLLVCVGIALALPYHSENLGSSNEVEVDSNKVGSVPSLLSYIFKSVGANDDKNEADKGEKTKTNPSSGDKTGTKGTDTGGSTAEKTDAGSETGITTTSTEKSTTSTEKSTTSTEKSTTTNKPTSTKKPSPTKPSGPSIWDDIAKAVKISLISLGKLDNNPQEGGELDGNLYHRLSFDFGKDKTYRIYADHRIDGFNADNWGDLGLGYESPLPYVGDISVRASQGMGSAANASFDWRLNLNDDQW